MTKLIETIVKKMAENKKLNIKLNKYSSRNITNNIFSFMKVSFRRVDAPLQNLRLLSLFAKRNCPEFYFSPRS